MAAPPSPSSSPRLPSPPPIAEDQLGPKSPIALPNEHGESGRNPFEANASRRIRPGTKAADMALGPPLVPLTDIDSPFQLTEHLKSLHSAALHRNSQTHLTPIDRPTATRLAHPPEGIDKYLWLYELCRLLCKEINAMIVALFQDDPPCSALTCNEMRASEWQYLCAVHDPPKPCCAIDYCCHTLDWTNNVLTSQKNFPSRMALGGEQQGAGASAHAQLRQLTNIFRRVYRIFAHAWFQHREMYWKVEQRTGLYVFFKTVCDVYNLIPEDNYTVPPEAEGIEPPEETSEKREKKPSIMKREKEEQHEENQPHLRAPTSDAATTKRHRHTPSVGSESITTVLEDPEEDEEKAAEKLDETVVLSHDPPEYSAEPEKQTEKDIDSSEAPVPIKMEDESKSLAEVPIISVGEPVVDPPAHAQEGALPSTEASVKHEPEEAGDKAAPNEGSDTESHGSWQVLSSEGHSSPEVTPAPSATSEEVEPESAGEQVETSSETKEDEPAQKAKEHEAAPVETTSSPDPAVKAEDKDESVGSTGTDIVVDSDDTTASGKSESASESTVESGSEPIDEGQGGAAGEDGNGDGDVPVESVEEVPPITSPIAESGSGEKLSASERRRSKIPRAVSPAVKKEGGESPKP